MMAQTTAIYIVDDEPALLRAVGRLLRSAGFHVVTFESAQQFLKEHDPRASGCVILDVNMPGVDGLELQQQLSAQGSELAIIFLTGLGDVPTSVKAMKGGAIDYLTKPVDQHNLLAAIRQAFARNEKRRQVRTELADIQGRLQTLTPRERQVLEHVVAGKLNKQIASELGTVEKTIKVHRGRVMEKLEVKSLAEMVRLCERAGVQPAPANP